MEAAYGLAITIDMIKDKYFVGLLSRIRKRKIEKNICFFRNCILSSNSPLISNLNKILMADGFTLYWHHFSLLLLFYKQSLPYS
jgi:hypothetical protein